MNAARDAAEASRREFFACQVATELAALREDALAWAEYVAEAEATDVVDGLRRERAL